MIYTYNHPLMVLLILLVLWPVGFIALVVTDRIKGKPFRPVYRAVWPFMSFAEVFG